MATPRAGQKRKSGQMEDEPTTPKTSPTKRMKMSQAHKQTLIDNLQLELTEKSRQMRAHYALQCADLKCRIERRVNRVPINMRKMKMGDLLAQQQKTVREVAKPTPRVPLAAKKSPVKREPERPLPAIPQKIPSPQKLYSSVSPAKQRKRKSSTMQSDKENDEPSSSTSGVDQLPVQKNTKRAKIASKPVPPPAPASVPALAAQPKGPTSRAQKKTAKENPSGVLSPRSANAQAPKPQTMNKEHLPPLPVRENSPIRAHCPARPTSPSKSQSPFKAAMSGLSAFAKRGYAAAGAAGSRLTRPISREKEQAHLVGLGSASVNDLASSNRMLPPPRPLTAMSTLNASAATIIPVSPQRTASQASMHSQASQQSSSTNNTVVTKSTKPVAKKTLNKPTISRAATTATAARAKAKVVISSSTVSTISPKSKTGPSRPPTAASKRAPATSTVKKSATVTGTTGRVLRKRN